MGQHIEVEHHDNMLAMGDKFGDWDAKVNKIRVQSVGHGIPDDICMQAYYHEVTHAVLDLAGHGEWSSNESFVELLGQLYFQAEQTRKYT